MPHNWRPVPGVETIPLDEPPEEGDLGDLGHAGESAPEPEELQAVELKHDHAMPLGVAHASVRQIVLPCPFVRIVKRGMHGQDVVAIKRAVSAAGYRPWSMAKTVTFGPTLELELRRFQHAHGISATGRYGAPTHHALTPFFDAYGRHLLALEAAHHQANPLDEIRHAVCAVALFTLAHPFAIGYSMGPRRMEGVTRRLHPPALPGVADCSSLVTWDYYAGGGPDPNGLRFNGLGFTGTQATHCVDVPAPGPPGAIYLYGSGPDFEHEALGLGDGSVVSHGTAVTKHLPGDYRPVGRIVMPPELL